MIGKVTGEYRIIGAYDSETTNIIGKDGVFAFPILHQLGLIDCRLSTINAQNVENHTHIELYRHAIDLYSRLDEIAQTDYGFIPVICCHNLSFDMYGLSPYFSRCDNVKVLAKSERKPITFTICDEKGKPRLVFWDTLIFSGQSLKRMGEDCGYSKAVGSWDYDLIRTPDTPLTDDEISYACKDIYALIAWLSWWLERNLDIEESKLACRVVTKTGVVRERRRKLFFYKKGKGQKYTIGRFWEYLNKTQAPKTDDELYTMMGATRGGFTFCADNHASKVYQFDNSWIVSIYCYDATSMHPAQMVSHAYPIDFKEATLTALSNVFEIIKRTSAEKILKHWYKPFNSAVYAAYEFENIRPKNGTLYKENGILPLASARFSNDLGELNENSQDNQEFKKQSTYHDSAINPKFAFGKLISANKAIIYLTELGIWEVCQAYEFDSVKPLHGYMTGHFAKPSDMAVCSVMRFYQAKNAYKEARKAYYETGTITEKTAEDLRKCGIADFIINGMVNGTLSHTDVENQYYLRKADLNALYGIECSNEYRRDTVLTSSGIAYQGEFGICNAPNRPKTHYQYGQRIVGWSRIAQHIAMQLLEPYALDIVNGDTDSIKACIPDGLSDEAQKALDLLGHAIDAGKAKACERVKRCYPAYYDPLIGIGYYICEGKHDRFCASWNKSYVSQDIGKDGKRHFDFVIAGLPTEDINKLADRLYQQGMPFDDICNHFLGYNVTYANDLLHLHSRSFPLWGDISMHHVTDYQGKTSLMVEPSAMALFPMSKTVNDTRNKENAENMRIAICNNDMLETDPMIIGKRGIYGYKMVR